MDKERNLYVTFKLDNEFYGILIDYVVSIEKMMTRTRIPNAPKHVEGVVNLRGEVIPLIDLRKKLNMEEKEYGKDTRIIVVNYEDLVVGIIVDSSSEVREINNKNIDLPPAAEDNKNLEYLRGIAKTDEGLVTILNLSKFLTDERW